MNPSSNHRWLLRPHERRPVPRYLDAGPVVKIFLPSYAQRRPAGFSYHSAEISGQFFAACRPPRGLRPDDQITLFGYRDREVRDREVIWDFVRARYVFNISAWLRETPPNKVDFPYGELRAYSLRRIAKLRDAGKIVLPPRHARLIDELTGYASQMRLEQYDGPDGPPRAWPGL